MPSRTYRVLNRAVGKALHQYDMISNGDQIAVAVSGGTDSLVLLWILHERRLRSPVDYDLYPVYLDPGFKGDFRKPLQAYFERMGYRYRIETTDYGIRGHSAKNRENPCFLCSRLRRKRLFEIADETGCNKMALGHNKDDIIETLFLNIFYSGEISTMIPLQPFFGGKVTIIRPLAFTEADVIRHFAFEEGLPEFINPCPTAGKSKRREIKEMLNRLYLGNAKIKGNIFKSMSHVNRDYLLK